MALLTLSLRETPGRLIGQGSLECAGFRHGEKTEELLVGRAGRGYGSLKQEGGLFEFPGRTKVHMLSMGRWIG